MNNNPNNNYNDNYDDGFGDDFYPTDFIPRFGEFVFSFDDDDAYDARRDYYSSYCD